jgi:hypothetical protein
MLEEIKSGQAEIRSTLNEWLMDLKDGRKETTACNGATETEPDSRMMQSIGEHQEIAKVDAAVMLVGEPRKRRRICNLAAERRQKRKERSRGNRGYRRKSAAACRKVSRGAKVIWPKGKLIRRIGTQENCEPRKELAVARREMTRRAKAARRKGNIVRNKWTRAKAERGIQKMRTRHEGRKKMKDLGGGRPPPDSL